VVADDGVDLDLVRGRFDAGFPAKGVEVCAAEV
jgi:hypothetical protein